MEERVLGRLLFGVLDRGGKEKRRAIIYADFDETPCCFIWRESRVVSALRGRLAKFGQLLSSCVVFVPWPALESRLSGVWDRGSTNCTGRYG